jgi:hypothetical protein
VGAWATALAQTRRAISHFVAKPVRLIALSTLRNNERTIG